MTSTPVLYVIIFLHSYIFQKYSIVKYMRGCSRWSTTLTSALSPPASCKEIHDFHHRLSPLQRDSHFRFLAPSPTPVKRSTTFTFDFHLTFHLQRIGLTQRWESWKISSKGESRMWESYCIHNTRNLHPRLHFTTLQYISEILGMGKSSWRFFSKIKVFFLEYWNQFI